MTDDLPQTELIDQAAAVGSQLLQQAQRLQDGSITWGRGLGIGRVPVRDSGIFNGRSGEALFLASLHAATGMPEFADASLAALHGIRGGLASARYGHHLLTRIGFGLSGIGSIIYALVRIGRYLSRPDLIDDAARVAESLTLEAVQRDHSYELYWGSAGALLGLLALHDAGASNAMEIALRCADHLLASRVPDPESGLRAWATSTDTLEVGFAHGSSGIAHALLQIHARTGESSYYEAAIEAFRFERALYIAEIEDWPDYRGQPPEQVSPRWCHGAIGVGFSRLAALGSVHGDETENVNSELRIAIGQAEARKVPGPDTLCCGSLGQIDFLLEAGLRLGKNSLVDRAYALGRTIFLHMRRRGYHPIYADESAPSGPGLWQGHAGIGYIFLRLAQPDLHPCILLLA